MLRHQIQRADFSRQRSFDLFQFLGDFVRFDQSAPQRFRQGGNGFVRAISQRFRNGNQPVRLFFQFGFCFLQFLRGGGNVLLLLRQRRFRHHRLRRQRARQIGQFARLFLHFTARGVGFFFGVGDFRLDLIDAVRKCFAQGGQSAFRRVQRGVDAPRLFGQRGGQAFRHACRVVPDAVGGGRKSFDLSGDGFVQRRNVGAHLRARFRNDVGFPVQSG